MVKTGILQKDRFPFSGQEMVSLLEFVKEIKLDGLVKVQLLRCATFCNHSMYDKYAS